TTSWPSWLSARATSSRTDSSSSARRTRAIAASVQTRDHVAPAEETHLHIAALFGRRGEPAAERQPLSGFKHRLGRHRGPAIDFGAGRVPKRDPKPRTFT